MLVHQRVFNQSYLQVWKTNLPVHLPCIVWPATLQLPSSAGPVNLQCQSCEPEAVDLPNHGYPYEIYEKYPWTPIKKYHQISWIIVNHNNIKTSDSKEQHERVWTPWQYQHWHPGVQQMNQSTSIWLVDTFECFDFWGAIHRPLPENEYF